MTFLEMFFISFLNLVETSKTFIMMMMIYVVQIIVGLITCNLQVIFFQGIAADLYLTWSLPGFKFNLCS